MQQIFKGVKCSEKIFQHLDDKIGLLREKLMCCRSTSAAIFNHCGLLYVGNRKRIWEWEIVLGAGIWGNQNIESCGVEQTSYFRF